jgi:cytosine/adenosine deaminase-related metal-dependent hydrolase
MFALSAEEAGAVPTLLVRHAAEIITMDPARRRIPDGAILVRDHVIEAIGPTDELPASADRVIEARDMVIIPGMVNTHHHLYQTLTRALPAVEHAKLFDWLVYLYPLWARMDSEAAYVSAVIGLAELVLTGCTTVSDHLYVYPNDVEIGATIQAAREIGVRFHPCRGGMSLGKSQGGLPPDEIVEDEEHILRDLEEAVRRYHDPAPYSMLRIVAAPCSPFSVTPALMRQTAEWARRHGITLHTHVAETRDEEQFCLERFGMRPVAYMESLGWLGQDVWFAHVVHVNDAEIRRLAATGTGVAHCPTSNMRLGSGIAPVRRMLDAGVKVGLAVDGSASNDGGHMLLEARMAMLLQRVQLGADGLTVEEALEMATLGGARVLGRDDIGSLEVGKAADFVGFRLDTLEYAGAHDAMCALLLCAPRRCDLSVIQGRVVVESGRLVTLDLERFIARQNELARRLVENKC